MDFDDDFLPGDNEDNASLFIVYHKQLYAKARELHDLIMRLRDSLPDAVATDRLTAVNMMERNINIACSKLAGDAIYHSLMENAVLIKVNMQELKAMCFGAVEMETGYDKSYIQVIEDEVEQFRQLFIMWASTFDKTKDYPDEWGLFNNSADFD